ncbi:MAG: hypothetical protein ACKO8I_05430 [Cyanobacteriota bacterium]
MLVSTRSRARCSPAPAAGEEEAVEVVVVERVAARRDPQPGCSGLGGYEGVLASRQSQSQQTDNGAPRVHRQLYGEAFLLGSSST